MGGVNRLISLEITTSVGTTTWTAPAGVTVITVENRTANEVAGMVYPVSFIEVVPNTTYTITTNDTTWDTTGDAGTFGSLLTFPSSTRLLISWVE